MGLFEELTGMNVLGPIAEKLDSGEFWLDEKDWKVHYKVLAAKKSPWIAAKFALDRDCMAGSFYFNVYGFMSRCCRQCWKVVGKVKTLKQLMQMEKLQEKLDLPSKCGYEEEGSRWPSRRGGLYSAFWYVPIKEAGIKGGLELRDWLQKEVDRVFGKGEIELKLKRACTEMERAFGDSKNFDKVAEQRRWDDQESILERLFVHEGKKFLTKERLLWERSMFRTVKLLDWIRFAARNGDMTYLEFVDKPFDIGVRAYREEDLYEGQDIISAKDNAEGKRADTGEEGDEGGSGGAGSKGKITLI